MVFANLDLELLKTEIGKKAILRWDASAVCNDI